MTENKRKYDIVLIGATGITGKHVIGELAAYHADIKWAIAGRNPKKLRSALKEVGDEINKNLNAVDIIEADVNSAVSISAMCRSTTVLINCVGPYRFSGEKVTDICVENKTHCIDVSAEPLFLETVQLKYFEDSKTHGAYIVGCCGADSILCDFVIETIKKKFDGDMNSVERYLIPKLASDNALSYASWQSLVHDRGHTHELMRVRKALQEKVFPKPLPTPNYKLKARTLLFKSKEDGGWCVPYVSCDGSAVSRSQMYNFQFKNERPVQFHTYLNAQSLIKAIIILVMGTIFMCMVKFSLGRYMLEKFPEVFTLGAVTRTPLKMQKAASGSLTSIFKVSGWSEKLSDPTANHTQKPNKSVTAIVKAPEPPYITTAICVVSSALVVLKEKDKLPSSGGVYTPATAFADTTLMEKLEERGITFTFQ